MNSRIEKLEHREKKVQFARDCGFFLERAFSRPIYGPIWLLSVLALISYFQSPLGGTEPSNLSYFTYLVTLVALISIIGLLARKNTRVSWLAKSKKLNTPSVYWISLRAIPVLLAICLFNYIYSFR